MSGRRAGSERRWRHGGGGCTAGVGVAGIVGGCIAGVGVAGIVAGCIAEMVPAVAGGRFGRVGRLGATVAVERQFRAKGMPPFSATWDNVVGDAASSSPWHGNVGLGAPTAVMVVMVVMAVAVAAEVMAAGYRRGNGGGGGAVGAS